MIEKGFLLITDITGYTSFLTSSELEHAELIIGELFTSQLQAIDSPFKISNFQGDAILCYASRDDIVKDHSILKLVELIYSAFSKKMKEMSADPPCSCAACTTIDKLDLKIFMHYGEYLQKMMGDREELIGSDVILIHRMMKNDVRVKTGIDSYLLITDAALDQLFEDPDTLNLTSYSEVFDHIGNVAMHVSPLQAIFKKSGIDSE